MAKSSINKRIEIKNRKASHEYEFLDTYTAGLVLKGTEIKSIRQSKASLQEGYCFLDNGEAFIKGMHIGVYEEGGRFNHNPTRTRKLLLNKREIKKLTNKMKDKGLTIVPVKLFISERGFAKLFIALGKGKKLFDKRDTLRTKDQKRDIQRALKP